MFAGLLATFGGWFAKQAVQLIVGGLALVGVALIPVATSQYVALNGWPIIGHGGLRAEAAGLHKEIDEPVTGYRARLAAADGRAAAFQVGLGTCNASVDRLKAEGEANTKAAEARLAAARSRADTLNRRVGVLLAAQPKTSDLCADADALIKESLQ